VHHSQEIITMAGLGHPFRPIWQVLPGGALWLKSAATIASDRNNKAKAFVRRWRTGISEINRLKFVNVNELLKQTQIGCSAKVRRRRVT
jgi:hypothetical protein